MRHLILTSLLLIGLSVSANAEIGQTAAPFLRLGVGAREAAMGGAVVADNLEANALFWNPAGLATLKHTQVTLNHSEHLLGTRYDGIAVAGNFKNLAGIGAGVVGFFVGDLEKRTGPSDEPLSSFGGYDLCFQLGAGRQLSRSFSAGLNGKLIHEKMDEHTSTAFGFDAGVSYITGIKDLKLGAALQNIGTSTRFKREGFSLPASFKVGFNYAAKGDVLAVASEIVKPFEDDLEYRLGGEVKIGDAVRLRSGYRTGFSQLGNLAGFVAGVGFNLNYINIDYAVDPYGPLGLTHKISVSYSFSKSEKLTSGMAAELSRKTRMTARSFHSGALSYYTKGKIEEAIKAWDLALVWDPSLTEARTMLQKANEEKKKRKIQAHLETANRHMDKGDFVDALYEFNMVLDLDPENSMAERMLERASTFITKLELERRLKGAASVDELVRHYNKAASLYAQKRYTSAISEWKKVLELEPGHKNARDQIAKAKRRLKKETAELLKSASDLVGQKKLLAALEKVDAVLKRNPGDPEAAQKKRDIKNGLRQAAQSRLEKGIDLFNRNELTLAEGHLRMVLKLAPNNPTAKKYLDKILASEKSASKGEIADLYFKGIAAYTNDDFETAILYWEKVLQFDPEHDNARRNIERARAKLSRIESK